MEKHSITIDTEKNIFLIDGKPIKNAEKIEIEVTPLETEITLNLKKCDVIFSSKAFIMDKNKEMPAQADTEQANSCEKISEIEFTKIIDGIYDYIHNRALRNGPIKRYPDLKISEYKKMFNL